MRVNDMYSAVCRYLEKIVNSVKPDEIYIAIDGVAPAAKMEQQRDRRYKSTIESKYMRELAIKHGKPVREELVDFNMISPGTVFMSNLQEYLLAYLHSQEAWRCMTVTLDGSDRAGEGEHKIMQDIREREDPIQPFIYGLDADLIFLSLINNPDIILVRESMMMTGGGRSAAAGATDEFQYLKVRELHDILVKTLSPVTTLPQLAHMGIENRVIDEDELVAGGELRVSYYHPATCQRRLILDYAYTCFLLGNDFLPRLPCLHMRDNSLNHVIVIYKIVAWRLGDFLVNEDLTINRDFLLAMFKELAAIEDALLEEATENRHQRISQWESRMRYRSPYERECEAFNYVENRYADNIRAGTAGWRQRYYSHHIHLVAHHENEYTRRVTLVCKEYLRGMSWVLNYYLGTHKNHSWMYTYAAAPTAEDMCTYLAAYRHARIRHQFEVDSPVSPYVQLLSILPPDSAGLLPKGLQSVMTNKDSVMHVYYPLKIKVNFHGNRLWHECRALLPHIDRELLKTVVDVADRHLTDSERARNTSDGPKHVILATGTGPSIL
jgi:5'-3' exonuclease